MPIYQFTRFVLGASFDRCNLPAGMLGLPELQFVADEGLARFAGRLQVRLLICHVAEISLRLLEARTGMSCQM